MIYFVPTPIGNLGDITIRGKEILHQSKVIICEDTRQTGKLLDLLQIRNDQKLISSLYKEKFNYGQIEKFFGTCDENDIISIVSDAGTPAISDPGYEVLEMIIEKDLPYTVLPGATAFVPALVASGLPSHEFLFVGFLPLKKGRMTKLKQLAMLEETTVILYESSHRLEKFIGELKTYFNPDAKVFIANDISKMHERFWRGNVQDLTLQSLSDKGEFVVLVNSEK